jgi:hypothetical protein
MKTDKIKKPKLTKEEYFASLAMPVMLKYALEHGISNIFETVAIDSMNMAKTMIQRSELNKKLKAMSPYQEYLEYCKTIEEPDYRFLVEDPNQNCVRPLTEEEFKDQISKSNPGSDSDWLNILSSRL